MTSLVTTLIYATLLFGMPAQADDPRETDVTERVEVELFLLDVTVTDRRREIVTGLTKDDFVLKIDNEKTPIASLDMHCPETPIREPEAVDIGKVGSGWEAPDRPRKIVFAIDYRHLERIQRVEVLEQVRDAVRRLHRSQEHLMIVALADFLRIESPWTTDGDETLAVLERMENDITLWEPPFDHLHDAPTFDALLDLTDLLGTIEGEKIVIVFSNWPSSGFHYDELFSELASRSARSRVSFYTVWTRGLTEFGTSRPLARLAVETGGRFTERTNDFSLGYARAQRDSTCRYTIGFYDSGEDPERERRVVLRVDRPGVRVFHHDRYQRVDAEDTRTRVAEAALAWPELYASESVRVALLPLRPTGRRRWETVFAVQSIAVADERVQLETRVRRGNRRWRRPAEMRETPFAFAQSHRLSSGNYAASATLSYAGEPQPHADVAHVDLPVLEGDGWWLADPIVLRARGVDPVDAVTLEGTELEGDPLLGRAPVLLQAAAGEELFVLGRLCRYGRQDEARTPTVTIVLTREGERVSSVDVPLVFAAGQGLECRVVDRPLPELSPGRYTVSVRADPEVGIAGQHVFVVTAE